MSTNNVTFNLEGGSKVEVTPLDPTDRFGKRYDFIITHANGKSESFIYTPLGEMNDQQKNERSTGEMTMYEMEALLIFQNNFEDNI